MRPSISIATKGLEESLREHVRKALEEGPLCESEIWDEALEFLSPRVDSLSSSLVKSYKLRFGRKIGKKTARENIVQHLRLVLSDVKKGLMHTQRPIIAGGNRFGRIFYVKGQEGKLQAKARELVEEGGGNQLETLRGVAKGPVAVTPKNERAVDLLEHYGLAERRRIGGKDYVVEPGYNPVEADLAEKRAEKFPDHFRVWRPFKAEAWVLRDGPTTTPLKFDLAAWDPVEKQFYLALDRDYVGVNHLRAFRSRQLMLGLPARMLVFCGSVSKSARKYAKRWGIELRMTTGE